MDGTDIPTRLERIRAHIRETAYSAGRRDEVTLVAVSKTIDSDRVRVAMEAGQRVFGENRVREALVKMDEFRSLDLPPEWHLLGHLQTNKARNVVGQFNCVQSLDTLRLAVTLDKIAGLQAIRLPVLLEVNVAQESSKSGFDAMEVEAMMTQLLSLPSLRFDGLMTIAPNAADPEDVRWVFRALRELRDRIRDKHRNESFSQLSMGMSGDYTVAIQEGATIVRIGRALFGERPLAPSVRRT